MSDMELDWGQQEGRQVRTNRPEPFVFGRILDVRIEFQRGVWVLRVLYDHHWYVVGTWPYYDDAYRAASGPELQRSFSWKLERSNPDERDSA